MNGTDTPTKQSPITKHQTYTGRVVEEVPPSLDAPIASATATPLSSRNAAPTTINHDPALPLAPPPLARLNHTLANALILPCDDPRCVGRCHAPDAAHFCGPHGGSCTRSPLAPQTGGSGKSSSALPPHVPPDQCSFNWSYGAGQYASRATGVLMRGSVALGPSLVVADAVFGAILKVSKCVPACVSWYTRTCIYIYRRGKHTLTYLLTDDDPPTPMHHTTTQASDGFYPTPAAAGILGLSFGNGSLCGAEHSCWPPLLDDLPGTGACVGGWVNGRV